LKDRRYILISVITAVAGVHLHLKQLPSDIRRVIIRTAIGLVNCQ